MKLRQRKRQSTPDFLLIDAGNTRVKWTLAGRSWPKRILGDIATTDLDVTTITKLARKYPRHLTVLSCVVPKLLPAFRRAFSGRLQEVGARMPEECFGWEFRFAYPKPDELGADRIAAAIAIQAWNLHPAIVISCGTATAFTVIDAKGRLCGGAIAPGLQAQLDALVGATAQLPSTKLRMPRSPLAKSTRDAIRTGVILNFQGGLKEITTRLIDSLSPSAKTRSIKTGRKIPTRIILTGGNAQLAAKAFAGPVTVRPLLIFEGLLIIAARLWMPAE